MNTTKNAEAVAAPSEARLAQYVPCFEPYPVDLWVSFLVGPKFVRCAILAEVK